MMARRSHLRGRYRRHRAARVTARRVDWFKVLRRGSAGDIYRAAYHFIAATPSGSWMPFILHQRRGQAVFVFHHGEGRYSLWPDFEPVMLDVDIHTAAVETTVFITGKRPAGL